MYDTIIIGAGLSSLTTAAVLAKKGLKVLVIEKNNNAGGSAGKLIFNSSHFDYSLHNFGPYTEHKKIMSILSELKIDKNIDFSNFVNYQKIFFPKNTLNPSSGIDNFLEELIAINPDETKGLKKIFKIASKLFTEFNEFQELGIGVDEISEKLPSFPMMFPNISFLSHKSLDDFLNEYLKDPKIKGIVSCLWWLFGIPTSDLSAVLYFFPFYGYFQYGGGVFNDTSSSIVQSLVDTIENNNGKIIFNTLVEDIITDTLGNVSSVKDSNGEIYKSKTVVSGIGHEITFNSLIKSETIEQKTIQTLIPSLSVLSIFFTIDAPKSNLGINDHSLSIYESYDHKENYEYSNTNNFEKSTLLVTMPDTISFNNKNKTVFNILTLCNSKIEINLSDANKIIFERISKIYPTLSKFNPQFHNITPIDLEKRTGTSALYGFAQTTNFSGVKRFSNKSSIPGLYLTGKDTFPGAGYPSVIVSGELAATRIQSYLKEVK